MEHAQRVDGVTLDGLHRLVAVHPLLTTESSIDVPCGLCGESLVHLEVSCVGHRVEVLSCSACGWHTRRIDGALATRRDLLELPSRTPTSEAGADAVTWYEGHVNSRTETDG